MAVSAFSAADVFVTHADAAAARNCMNYGICVEAKGLSSCEIVFPYLEAWKPLLCTTSLLTIGLAAVRRVLGSGSPFPLFLRPRHPQCHFSCTSQLAYINHRKCLPGRCRLLAKGTCRRCVPHAHQLINDCFQIKPSASASVISNGPRSTAHRAGLAVAEVQNAAELRLDVAAPTCWCGHAWLLKCPSEAQELLMFCMNVMWAHLHAYLVFWEPLPVSTRPAWRDQTAWRRIAKNTGEAGYGSRRYVTKVKTGIASLSKSGGTCLPCRSCDRESAQTT